MFKRILSVLLIAILASGTFGCGKTQNKQKDEAKSKSADSLSIYSYKPDTFCPIASNNEANIRLLGIIYDGLVSLEDNLLPRAALAESWKSEEGNTKWSLSLRKNVAWHSGGEFSADDVVYTVNQIKKLESSPYKHNVSPVSKVEKAGDGKVVFTLTKPLANFVSMLYFPIIKSGAEELDAVGFRPDGTGAYKFEDRNEGNIYYLVRNEKWWGGRAKAQTIEVRMLPGGDTALYAFGSGTIDMTPAENMDWGKFVDTQTAEYTYIPQLTYTFLGINHKNPQLEMEELRRAVAAAINRDEIIDKARMGYGVSVNSPMRPEWYVYENQDFDRKPNAALAKKLLEENGWTFKNNLYRKNKDGVEYTASFGILINEENTVRKNVAGIIVNNLEELGVKASIVSVPFDEYTKRISEGNYDAFVGSMVISPELDFSHLLGEGNVFAFEDEEMRFVMSEIQKKQSEAEIKSAYAEFINLFEHLNPVVGLYFENSVMIYSKQISGEVSPSCFDVYRGIESLEKTDIRVK